MSKRAKELMRQMTPVIIEALANRHNITGADEKIEALIDAELRNERERAAKRVRNAKFIRRMDQGTGTGDWISIPEWATEAHINAVLSEED